MSPTRYTTLVFYIMIQEVRTCPASRSPLMGLAPHDAATCILSSNFVCTRISDQPLALHKTSVAALARFQDMELGLQLLYGI